MTDVLWVTTAYPWDGAPVGGIFHRSQARALARLGFGVTVAVPTPWTPPPLPRLRRRWAEYAGAPRAATDDGIAIVRPRYVNVPGQPAWAIPDRLIAEAAWRARDAWRGARLIHGHFAVTGLAAWRLARRARLPLVLTFHGDDLNTWPDLNPERRDDLRLAIREAAFVVTVSAALGERVRALAGVEPVHLPLGSDHRAMAAVALPRAEARRRLGLPDDRIVVLYVGYLLPEKGVRELADGVVAAGPRFLGVFVGDGPELGYRPSGDGAGGRLDYRGERRHDEVIAHLSAADVLVLPSRGEGLPTVIVEAGSLGVPVIASAVGGIPELLGADRGTLLAEVSPTAIAGALVDFADHRAEAEAAAERLREHVRAEYDVDRNAARLLERYRSATGALAGVR